MSNIREKTDKDKYQALYEELEGRYGGAMAQEIVDQIKKTDAKDEVCPDYMAVKAVSETVEHFRGRAHKILHHLKTHRAEKEPDADVVDLEEKRLEAEFRMLFGCYRDAQRAFERLYQRFMAAYVPPSCPDYQKKRHKPETSRAA